MPELFGLVPVQRLLDNLSAQIRPESVPTGETLGRTLAGEIMMGSAARFSLGTAQAAVIHTGGMVPVGADAVVMIERTQRLDSATIEVLRAVAPGENVIDVGEDVLQGEKLLEPGHVLRPQDIGGLTALGIAEVAAAKGLHDPQASLALG